MRGHIQIIMPIITSESYPDLSSKVLGNAFIQAASKGHTNVVKAIIACKSFKEIHVDTLNSAYLWSVNKEIAQVIENSGRFNELSSITYLTAKIGRTLSFNYF